MDRSRYALCITQVEKARNDELKHWEDNPKSILALILLQDQFCRGIYKVSNELFLCMEV